MKFERKASRRRGHHHHPPPSLLLLGSISIHILSGEEEENECRRLHVYEKPLLEAACDYLVFVSLANGRACAPLLTVV